MKNKTSNKNVKIIFTTIKLLILVLFLNGNQLAFAQETSVHTVQNETELKKEFYDLIDVDVKPNFPGGLTEFYNFVAKNFRVPQENKLNGKVFIQFVVEVDGSLSNFKVLRDLGNGTGDEAVRVLKKSPKWKPGILNEKPVRVLTSLPITIGGN